MASYQEHALEGASAVDLVVALYDGILRFLMRPSRPWSAATRGRRGAVKRALDIIIHLQARLRMDVGGTAGAGVQRVLRVDLCADSAGLAVGFEAQVRARHRLRAQCARRLAQVARDPEANPGPRRGCVRLRPRVAPKDLG